MAGPSGCRGFPPLKFVQFIDCFVSPADHDILVVLETGTCRDEVTADDVLLQTLEVIDAATDGGLAENLRCLLEGSCRDETVGAQSGAGDTLEDEGRGSRPCVARDHHLEALPLEGIILAAGLTRSDDLAFGVLLRISGVLDDILSIDGVIHIHEMHLVDEFLIKEFGVSRVGDLNLAHHLTNDDFEVFVVDLHTLEAVHCLDLVDDVLLSLDRSEDGEDVAGRHTAVRQRS